jgi:hypothetical protein
VKRTWWIVPYFSGMLAVFAVAGVLSATVLHHSPKPKLPALVTPTVYLPMPAQMVTDTLFRTLTSDLQAHNETGFLSLTAPAVRPTVRTWWQNISAIGYTTGVVIPAGSNSVVDLDQQGNGTIAVLAGAHSALDPLSDSDPDIPCERYLLTLHFATPTAIGQITGWRPLASTAVDQEDLYVRTGNHLVVAGPVTDKAAVNAIAPLAEAAANYTGNLVSHVNANDLHQDGFVVFVSGDTAQAQVLVLPGASGDMTGIATGISAGVTGGARVIIPATQETVQETSTAQLVRLFMLDILAPDDEGLASGLTPPAVRQWTTQGLADAVRGLYAANPNPLRHDFSVLMAAVKALPAPFRTGQLPTNRELSSGSKDWGLVAASVYTYIGRTYGMNQMFASAALLWTGEPTPFGNVLASSKDGTYDFFASATVEDGWRAWLASLH